jgi:tryptophan synthase alpha chain
MSRLAAAFAGPTTPRLVTYATAGDPDLDRSAGVIRAMARGGADVIEIGVPFSDPIADGPVIQRASERALAAGATLARTLDLVERVRAEVRVPLVLFTYVNRGIRRARISSRRRRRAAPGPADRGGRRDARGACRPRHRSDLSRQSDDHRRAAA